MFYEARGQIWPISFLIGIVEMYDSSLYVPDNVYVLTYCASVSSSLLVPVLFSFYGSVLSYEIFSLEGDIMFLVPYLIITSCYGYIAVTNHRHHKFIDSSALDAFEDRLKHLFPILFPDYEPVDRSSLVGVSGFSETAFPSHSYSESSLEKEKPIFRDHAKYNEEYLKELAVQLKKEFDWNWLEEYSLENTVAMHKEIENLLEILNKDANVVNYANWVVLIFF
jgi:hypothetical protein